MTGVGYNPSGLVLCNNEVVRDGSHPSFTKLMEVTHGFPCSFLADRTNGRAHATALRPSVIVCDVMCFGYTVRPRAKVTIDSL